MATYTDVQIRNLFPTYFDAAATTTRIDEDIIRQILKIYSSKEGGSSYIAKKLKFNPSVITRFIETAIGNNILKRVKPGEFKTKEAQRIYAPGEARKIYREVRPITANDRKIYPDIPKNAKWKVQVPSGQKKPTSTKMVYTTTKSGAENALKKADKLTETLKIAREKPFKDAVKKLHGLALKDPEVLKNFNKLAQEMYGIAKNTQELVPKQKWLALDLVKYREFLQGFTAIKGLAAPTAEQLDDILFEFPAENKYRQYGSEAVRQSKFKIRDQLLKTTGPKFKILRDNIIKYSNTVGRELDEAMGLSATFERAPGYTELGQLIAEKANQAKRSEIDAPFSRIFKRVVEGDRGPINVLKNKYATLDEAITDFNKVSKNFQKTWKVDTPIIEFKPGEILDPSKFIKHFDKLSKEAKANVTQLAEKGIGLRSRAMPMIEMLYGIYKKSEGADKIAIQTILGCRKAAESGGRIGFATGTLDVCVNTKLTNQTLESGQKIVAGIEEGATGVLGKMRNTARGFLGALGKFGPAAGKFGALAAVGAAAPAAVEMVRQFMNDDPSTYLTDEHQQAGMLDALIEKQERKKPRSEILDWGTTAGTLGATAAAVPGSGALYKYRRGLLETKIPKAGPVSEAGLTAGDYIKRHGKGYGKLRAGAGVGMKLLSGMFTPAGLLATEPLRIAQMRREGEDWGEIATSPHLWMGPAFASGMTGIATSGMKKGSLLAKALRLGISPAALKTISRRFGMPGLALSLGLSGYETYQDYKKKRGWFAKD